MITSSVREVVPVVRVDARIIGDGRPGRWTRALHRRYRDDAGLAGQRADALVRGVRRPSAL